MTTPGDPVHKVAMYATWSPRQTTTRDSKGFLLCGVRCARQSCWHSSGVPAPRCFRTSLWVRNAQNVYQALCCGVHSAC